MKKITTFINQLFQHLGFLIDEIKVEIKQDDNNIQVNITVPDADIGMVVGKRGETLLAIQRLVRVVFNQDNEKKIQLDINHYRQEKLTKLKDLVREAAKQVKENKQPTKLATPLSSYERFIVHQLISDEFPKLSSESVGFGRDRRVVIKPNKDG